MIAPPCGRLQHEALSCYIAHTRVNRLQRLNAYVDSLGYIAICSKRYQVHPCCMYAKVNIGDLHTHYEILSQYTLLIKSTVNDTI
jgi:hypothetical protein